MKRIICSVLFVFVLFGCLTACDMEKTVQGMMDSMVSKAESGEKVEEMISALEENRVADAKALMHPDAADVSDDAIAQMVKFLDGRKIGEMEITGIKLNSSTGGKTEELVYLATLDDGNTFFVSTEYVSNDDGVGFIVFQFAIGIISSPSVE